MFLLIVMTLRWWMFSGDINSDKYLIGVANVVEGYLQLQKHGVHRCQIPYTHGALCYLLER